MATLVASKDTNATLTIAHSTVIDWVDIRPYDITTLNFILENTGGANDIDERIVNGSNDGGLTTAVIDTEGGNITAGETDTKEIDCTGYDYIQLTAKSAAGGTTAQAWIIGDLTTTVDAHALTTLAKLKAYLGITSTTYDAVLALLINAATESIETYCGRRFKSRAYTMERYHGDRTCSVMVDNWPIISVERVVASTANALQVRCTAADAYSGTVSVTRSGDPEANTALKLSIHGGASDGDTSLAFATYATLTTLAAQVNLTAGWSATVMGSYGGWASTEILPHPSKECLAGSTIMEVPDTRLEDYRAKYDTGEIFYGGGFGSGWYNIYVDYTGGYATIPADLELLCIRIVGDIFNSRSVNAALKSEKIGDYSYTLGDTADIDGAVYRYEKELSKWARIPVG